MEYCTMRCIILFSGDICPLTRLRENARSGANEIPPEMGWWWLHSRHTTFTKRILTMFPPSLLPLFPLYYPNTPVAAVSVSPRDVVFLGPWAWHQSLSRRARIPEHHPFAFVPLEPWSLPLSSLTRPPTDVRWMECSPPLPCLRRAYARSGVLQPYQRTPPPHQPLLQREAEQSRAEAFLFPSRPVFTLERR